MDRGGVNAAPPQSHGIIQMSTYPLHPACAVWPRMPENELKELAADMLANGQLEAATITPDGMLLDGANRQDACAINGTELIVATYDGEPFAYSLSKNKHRRHMMDKVALAFVCAKMAKLQRGGNGSNQYAKRVNTPFAYGSKARAALAKAAGVPEYDLRDAKAVLDQGIAEIIDLTKAKKVGMRAAADYVRSTPKDKQVADAAVIKGVRRQRVTAPLKADEAFERGRLEGLAEAAEQGQADPSELLPKTAQEKLATFEKRLRAQLDSEFEQRVREEVKRRLAERDTRDDETIAQANELILHSSGRQRPPFSPQEYYQLLWALHPDSNDPTKATAAFVMVRQKKLILCDEGTIKRKSSDAAPLPTLEEMLARRRRRA